MKLLPENIKSLLNPDGTHTIAIKGGKSIVKFRLPESDGLSAYLPNDCNIIINEKYKGIKAGTKRLVKRIPLTVESGDIWTFVGNKKKLPGCISAGEPGDMRKNFGNLFRLYSVIYTDLFKSYTGIFPHYKLYGWKS